MEWIANPDIWLSLLTLTVMEVVLGIDNLVFIAILASRLPEGRQAAARSLGLGVALVTRLLLLFALTWLIGLTKPLFSLFDQAFSLRDLVLIAGGLFLIAKAVYEIDHDMEGEESEADSGAKKAAVGFAAVVIQIGIIDIVFSLDSVITAVGMAKHLEVMVAAIVIAVAVMVLASGAVSRFVNAHPTVKMLALAFLVLIGVMLVADGVGFHIPKGYIYFSMGFAMFVEALNLLRRRGRRRRRMRARAGAGGK